MEIILEFFCHVKTGNKYYRKMTCAVGTIHQEEYVAKDAASKSVVEAEIRVG